MDLHIDTHQISIGFVEALVFIVLANVRFYNTCTGYVLLYNGINLIQTFLHLHEQRVDQLQDKENK